MPMVHKLLSSLFLAPTVTQLSKPSLAPWPQCSRSRRVKSSCRTGAGRRTSGCDVQHVILSCEHSMESVEQKATQYTRYVLPGTVPLLSTASTTRLRCWRSHQSHHQGTVIANRFFIRIGLFAGSGSDRRLRVFMIKIETHLKFPSMLAGKILFFIDANREFIES